MHNKFANAFPNFQFMSLDPVHLAIVYEYASRRKRTAGSSLLRAIMTRFTAAFPPGAPEPVFCGYIFDGSNAGASSIHEESLRDYIIHWNMPLDTARAVAARQKGAGPFGGCDEFIEALAALCALYPKEVDKVPWSKSPQVANPTVLTIVVVFVCAYATTLVSKKRMWVLRYCAFLEWLG